MGIQQRSVVLTLLFAVVMDVVTEIGREGQLSELLYAEDLVLMSETTEGIRNKFTNGRMLLIARV